MLTADVHDPRTARVEITTDRRIGRAGDISLQNNSLPLLFDLWIRDGDCGKQGLGIRVARILIQFLAPGQLYDLAQIHHRDAVGDMAHNREIMGNKEIGQAHFSL